VKAQKGIVDEHYAWVINYLAISKCPLGLIINFGENSLVTCLAGQAGKKDNIIICESVAMIMTHCISHRT
ncbi:MAG: hypothetical protein KAQ62_20035, partial [Cyclobacteriaceae bacterium]|nr:hypothetical protein [Cyclobacteriaceae bacterium]